MRANTLRTLSNMLPAALMALGLCAAGQPADAQQADSRMTISPAQTASVRHVELGLGKSLVIDLPRDAKDVLVSDPEVADAVMRTARRAYLIGGAVGETNVFFFDEVGNQIAVLEVDVGRDLSGLARQIRRLVPGSSVGVESVNDNVVLTGSVRTPSDAVNAAEIAGRFIGDPDRVLNMIDTEGSEQVHLKVTIAEMRRDVVKELGVELDGLFQNGTTVAFNTFNPFAAGALGNLTVEGSDLSAMVDALEERDLLRVLAEPTLSATSGESAEFLAGGEFPVPVAFDAQSGTPTIEYKDFGVGLAFTPIVHNGGRMTLKVRTEVSEIAGESSVSGSFFSLPTFNTRRADTTVELPSGGALVLAGLIEEKSRQALSGIPGLKDLPVLGALFRSRSYVQNETELVVLATPYLVSPTSEQELTRPDKNFAPADDVSALLLGRLNKIYGASGAKPKGRYHGHVGFIVE